MLAATKISNPRQRELWLQDKQAIVETNYTKAVVQGLKDQQVRFQKERVTGIATAIGNNEFSVARDITVYQQNRSFVVENNIVEEMVIKVGDVLQFKNNDKVVHNVFSLSKIKPFDLGSIVSGKIKSVQFDKEGFIEIECAIHPLMYMVVSVGK